MIKKTLLAISFLLATTNLQAQAPEAVQKTLDSGLVALVYEMPNSPTVALYALVKAGSSTEGKFMGSGLSHFMEHMLFKGTTKRPSGTIAKEVRALGGIINATTGLDYTTYYIELPREKFSEALDILSDMLFNATFDPQELEREREVVYGEMRLHNDNPERKLSELILKTVYVHHPYRHPVIGYEELLRQVSRENFLDYYHQFYIPNNVVFSVAGGVDTQSALEQITKAFSEVKAKPYYVRNLPQEPEQISTRRAEEFYPTELTRMSMTYQSVPLLNQDMYALDVLSMIMGQGRSSRLYQSLYEKKKLVRSITSANFTPVDKGVFEIESVLEERNIEAVIADIKDQIAIVKQTGVNKVELDRAKRKVLSGHLYGRQSAGDVAYQMAADYAIAGDPDFSKKYVDNIKTLTADDIKRVANRYLNDNRLTIAILKPGNPQEGLSPKVKLEPAETEKFTLDNGLRILLREDHTFPIVSMNLLLQGGTGQEDPSVNGIAQLSAGFWGAETKAKPGPQFSAVMESMGGHLGGFSGRNSFGLRGSFLSEDLYKGLDLLIELVKTPGFSEDGFTKAKEGTITAIQGFNDDIFSVTGKALRETVFVKHPFRLEPVGTFETVSKLTRQDIIDFHNRFAVPNNMVLSVFGDFKKEELLPVLKAGFSDLPKREIALKRTTEDPPQEPREKNLEMDKEQALVMFGFQGAAMFEPQRYHIEVLTSILGSALSGRMFTKIRDELGQAYTLGAGYTPGMETGFIYFYVNTTEANVEKVKSILFEQIKDIQNTLVPEVELAQTKTYLKGTFKMSLDTPTALNFASALDELYGQGFNHYQTYDAKIDAVTPEDVKAAAEHYLNLSSVAVVITRPRQAN